jgi:PKD repeat protein
MNTIIRPIGIAVCAAIMAACTMQKQEAPPLTGPSELGTSVQVLLSPDVLPTDGGSQSLVTILARDSNGQPLRNLSLRTEIRVNGQANDFGSLSARNVVTDASGKATLVYTAPSISGGVDTGTIVEVMATPVGTNFSNATPSSATIRLVPTSVVVPPDGMQPDFTFTPSAPGQGQAVFFQSTSKASAVNPIVSFRWDFGDGETATGSTATHAYSEPATYFARLTTFDATGRSAFTTKSITVTAGTAPTADFTVSPTNPFAGDLVTFNAQTSRAASGRRIVSYQWDFGDTGTATGEVVTHTFQNARSFTIVLRVTDDLGVTSTTSRPLAVR